jgi:hypothetical protein
LIPLFGKPTQNIKNLTGNSSALVGQINLSSRGRCIGAFDGDQTEAWVTVTPLIADALNIPGHDETIKVQIAGVRPYWFAFIEGDGKEGDGVWKRY